MLPPVGHASPYRDTPAAVNDLQRGGRLGEGEREWARKKSPVGGSLRCRPINEATTRANGTLMILPDHPALSTGLSENLSSSARSEPDPLAVPVAQGGGVPLRLDHRVARPLERSQAVGVLLPGRQLLTRLGRQYPVRNIGPPLASVPAHDQAVHRAVATGPVAAPAVPAWDVSAHRIGLAAHRLAPWSFSEGAPAVRAGDSARRPLDGRGQRQGRC